MFEPEFFEWDEAKAASNFSKHGFSFNEAVCIFDDPGRRELDATRNDDQESRTKVVGLFRGRLFTLVFTHRGEVCRIISARRANAREEREYGNCST